MAGIIFTLRTESSMNIINRKILSRLLRDEPKITARPFDFANGKLLRIIAIPRREYIGIVISVKYEALSVKSSENNNVFAVRMITHDITAKDPA